MSSSIKMETSAIYQPAGVRFNLSLSTHPQRDQAQFNITVDDLNSLQSVWMNWDWVHTGNAAAHTLVMS